MDTDGNGVVDTTDTNTKKMGIYNANKHVQKVDDSTLSQGYGPSGNMKVDVTSDLSIPPAGSTPNENNTYNRWIETDGNKLKGKELHNEIFTTADTAHSVPNWEGELIILMTIMEP
ncbi:hypothetical protein [Xylocopilactobacillus apis]|uniref:Uncharacterized protein n=1 Tax=Xylocopilactobacillus apis TaxID=2932183 RepID=A0AAU9D1R5_9LACO|nr:hypothetical protein [Xylocopilactobacillus apis]BDR57478.1 hypothetical protein KIMC2_20400 [Xylocopilactobacillus apis]